MPDPANGILRALPEHLLVQASAQRHFHPIRFQILAPPALAASAPRRGNRSADPQPDQPKAQIPIAHRVRPAGSCMLGFRTLKRPKSFDDPERLFSGAQIGKADIPSGEPAYQLRAPLIDRLVFPS